MTFDRDHTDMSLGDELLAQIFALLPARGLVCAEASCTHWHQLIQTHALWQRLTENTWQEHRKEWWVAGVNWNVTSQKSWKSIYISMLATWRVLPMQKIAVKYLTGHTKPVTCLAASSHTIASAAADKTVRLWDRKTGACRHILQLPSRPSALHLLSDDLTVVTCLRSCSVWKGSRCLRSICPDLSVPARVTNNSYICASVVSDNLLFLVFDGASTIQVWDLYSGLQAQILRPVVSDSSAGDYYITALAAGTMHGHQILLVGIGNAALASWVLVLHQSDGQAAASPIPLPSRKWVARIDSDDGVAVAIMQHIHLLGSYSVPVPIHFSEAQVPGRQGRPAFTARSTMLAPLCSGPASDHITVWRQHNLAAAHLAAIPILVSIQRHTYPHPICLKFVVMVKDEEGLHAKEWYRCCPAITRPETGSQGSEPTPHTPLHADEGIVVHSCGMFLTTAFHHQVAVWQFPSFPDECIIGH